MENGKITALYCRVSTFIQIARGESVENQKSRLKRYADSCELRSRFYVDAGFSAKHIQRPQLTRLLSDIKKGKVERVLVTKLDRITRSIRDLIVLVGLFDDFGVSFQALDQSLDTSTAAGRAQVQLLAVLAEWERNIISERVSEDMRYRAKNGKWNGGPVPFGYITFRSELEKLKQCGMQGEDALLKAKVLCPEEKKLYPSRRDAAVVKKIFREYLKRESIRGVTDWLNTHGYKSPEGTPWSTQSVSRILRCVTYVGKIRYGRRASNIHNARHERWVEAQGLHEPIIEQSVFERVQQIIKIRTKHPLRKGSKYLLSGVLRCVCGGRMHGYSHHRGRTKWRYYRCSNFSRKGREVCKGNSVSRDIVEKTMEKFFLAFFSEDFFSRIQKSFNRFTSSIRNYKDSLLIERGRLLKAKESFIRNGKNKAQSELYQTLIEIEKIDAELGNLIDLEAISFDKIRNDLMSLPQKWKKSDFQERKRLLQSFIRSIEFKNSFKPLKIVANFSGCFQDLTFSMDRWNVFDKELSYSLEILLPQPWETVRKPKTFGDYLRMVRLKRGYLIKELAAKLGVSANTVVNWEKRGRMPDYVLIRNLKNIFSDLCGLSPALIYPDYPKKPKTAGEHLKQKRLHLDLSQKELADRLGVCADVIRDLEAGRTHIKSRKMLKESVRQFLFSE